MSHSEQNHQVLTFVVRLWHEADAHGCGYWRGRVENVGTQEVRYVEDLAAVVRFMECWIREPAKNLEQKGVEQ